MYDFEFDARKFRASSALPSAGRRFDDEFSNYFKSARQSVGRSLSVARDFIRESSVEPAQYYKAYEQASRARLSQLRENAEKESENLDAYLRDPTRRYYSYSLASPRKDYGRGFWWPYWSYPYTKLLEPSRPSRLNFDWNDLFRPYRPSWVRPGYSEGPDGLYTRPTFSNPRSSYIPSTSYEPSLSRKPFNRYSHYYIPKHYPGTPMSGGYLVPAGGLYGWRY